MVAVRTVDEMEVDEAARDAIEVELREVTGVINAAEARRVELVAEMVDRGDWHTRGWRSAQHWVSFTCGVASSTAQRLVAIAARRCELPDVHEVFCSGGLSVDQVKVVTDTVPAHYDSSAARVAPYCTVSQLRRALRDYRFIDDEDDQAEQPEPAAAKTEDDAASEPAKVVDSLWFGFSGGRWRISGDLDAINGVLVQQALEAERQALFGDDDSSGASWADALVSMANRAAAALDAHGDLRSRQRFQCVVHIDADKPAKSWLHLGVALTKAQRQRATCDTSIRALIHNNGRPVRLGRSQRTVPDWLRTLVEDTWHGCGAPGCGRTRWLEIHHIKHWEDGGETDPENLIALCGPCHRAYHAGVFTITGDDSRPDTIIFRAPDGTILNPAPPPRPPTTTE